MPQLRKANVDMQILIPDGRVTPEGLTGLVKSTGCKVWLYAEDDSTGPLVGEDAQLRTFALPTLDWILGNDEQKEYPYDKTFEQAARDVIVIIHTSDTTGIPKPIEHTNGTWTAMGSGALLSQRHWPHGIAHESWIGRTALNCCAPQWLAGLHSMIIAPAFMDSPCVMFPQDAVGPSPEMFKKILGMNRIDGLKCPPQTVVTLYENVEARVLLKSLKFIMFLGAALDRSIGDDLCQFTRVTPLIGSTETGDQLSIKPMDRKLWYTHDFVPENGSKMIRIDSEGNDSGHLYELVLDRPEDGGENIFQPAFWNPAFQNLSRIETKELYKPIADLDGRTRWIFTARKDDLTKLSWLAKFHAQDIEERIQMHPDVKSTCVGGEGRPAPYVIVELKEGALDQKSEGQLLDSLYETVISGANDVDVAEIRIPKETVFLAKKEKPFRRNLKQVVMRKAVQEDYREEIEEAYVQLERAVSNVVSSK
jgi:acyl-coenzyme A synthetase/AMP-(fatty) acid ligase